MSETPKPLPSDEKRIRAWFASSEHIELVDHEGIAEGMTLLAQVRAEASQEKDAEIERLRETLSRIIGKSIGEAARIAREALSAEPVPEKEGAK